MAKAKPITGLNAYAPVTENARIIVHTRLEEMFEWSQHVDNPYEVHNLHNLRIAAKRLRYTLELFEDVLPEESKAIVEELTKIQDELGALHDHDVLIALLRLCLGSQDGGVAYEQALSQANKQKGKAYLLEPELVAVVLNSKVAPSAEQRYGLEQLLHKHEQEREKTYQGFHQHWYELQARNFRRQILDLLNEQ